MSLVCCCCRCQKACALRHCHACPFLAVCSANTVHASAQRKRDRTFAASLAGVLVCHISGTYCSPQKCSLQHLLPFLTLAVPVFVPTWRCSIGQYGWADDCHPATNTWLIEEDHQAQQSPSIRQATPHLSAKQRPHLLQQTPARPQRTRAAHAPPKHSALRQILAYRLLGTTPDLGPHARVAWRTSWKELLLHRAAGTCRE